MKKDKTKTGKRPAIVSLLALLLTMLLPLESFALSINKNALKNNGIYQEESPFDTEEEIVIPEDWGTEISSETEEAASSETEEESSSETEKESSSEVKEETSQNPETETEEEDEESLAYLMKHTGEHTLNSSVYYGSVKMKVDKENDCITLVGDVGRIDKTSLEVFELFIACDEEIHYDSFRQADENQPDFYVKIETDLSSARTIRVFVNAQPDSKPPEFIQLYFEANKSETVSTDEIETAEENPAYEEVWGEELTNLIKNTDEHLLYKSNYCRGNAMMYIYEEDESIMITGYLTSFAKSDTIGTCTIKIACGRTIYSFQTISETMEDGVSMESFECEIPFSTGNGNIRIFAITEKNVIIRLCFGGTNEVVTRDGQPAESIYDYNCELGIQQNVNQKWWNTEWDGSVEGNSNQTGDIEVSYANGKVTVKGYIRDEDVQAPDFLLYRVYIGEKDCGIQKATELVTPETIDGKANTKPYLSVDYTASTTDRGKTCVSVLVYDYRYGYAYGKITDTTLMPAEKTSEVYKETLQIDNTICAIWPEGKKEEIQYWDNLIAPLYEAYILSLDNNTTYCIKLLDDCDCDLYPIFLSYEVPENFSSYMALLRNNLYLLARWKNNLTLGTHAFNAADTNVGAEWFQGSRYPEVIRMANCEYEIGQAKIELDLNDYNVNKLNLYMDSKTTLTVKNGSFTGSRPFTMEGGTLTLEKVSFQNCAFVTLSTVQKIDANRSQMTGSGGVNGGAISQTGGALYMKGCYFRGCKSNDRGGAAYCVGGTTEITDCYFVSNTASTNGGALYFDHQAATVVRCSFGYNSASWANAISVYWCTTFLGDSGFFGNGNGNGKCAIVVGEQSTLQVGGNIDNTWKDYVELQGSGESAGSIYNVGMSGGWVPVSVASSSEIPAIYHVTEQDMQYFNFVDTTGYWWKTGTETVEGYYFSASAFSDMEPGAILGFSLVLLPIAVALVFVMKKRRGVQK